MKLGTTISLPSPPPLQRRQRALTTEPKQKQINLKLPIFRLPLWQMHFLSGDSRTVGMMEYAGLTEANYFCSIGMNVFNIKKNRVSVPSVGKVTLEELLSNKKYGKIYIMLGINELGYDFQSIINKYGDLLDFVNGKQPNAAIFIQANLHVSKKRSDSDKYINNKNIDRLNSELSKSANGKSTFYIDANPLFDDKDGNLSLDKTSDNAHLYARYYTEWGEWICKETAKVLKERQS